MKVIIGWVAIILAILSLAPSIVPGAVSVMGLLISLGALIISVFSISVGHKNYFNITLAITFFDVFFVNDALRIWGSLPSLINAKITMYGLFFLVVFACLFFATKLSKSE